jgi:hypothetical protein
MPALNCGRREENVTYLLGAHSSQFRQTKLALDMTTQPHKVTQNALLVGFF